MFVERKGTVKPSFSYNFLIIYGLTVRQLTLVSFSFHPSANNSKYFYKISMADGKKMS